MSADNIEFWQWQNGEYKAGVRKNTTILGPDGVFHSSEPQSPAKPNIYQYVLHSAICSGDDENRPPVKDNK